MELTKRERQRYDKERHSSRSDHETRHLFIGGWEHFDLETFCKGKARKQVKETEQ